MKTLLALVAALILTACGQTGPLRLPAPKAKVAAAGPAAPATPAGPASDAGEKPKTSPTP